MRARGGLWWQQRRLWLPPALLLVAGAVALGVYVGVVAGRLGLEAGAVARRRAELAEVTAQRQQAETLLRRARAARAALDEVYSKRLGTEAERLTAVMLQVKQLARQAGLAGVQSITYTDAEVEDAPLAEKWITFTAEGDYAQLRSFINLLEVADSFLALEEIRVQDTAGSGRLQVAIKLATLFVDARPRAAREPGAEA